MSSHRRWASAVALCLTAIACEAFAPTRIQHEHAAFASARGSIRPVSSALRDSPSDTADEDVSDQVLKSLTSKLEKSKSESEDAAAADAPKKKTDNKSMAFLRRIGRVGGAANKDFVNACGTDEGSTGMQPVAKRDDGSGGGGGVPARKARAAYRECVSSGVVDDMTEPFPITSSGTEWRGVSDRMRGGESNGVVRRVLDLAGRTANLLTGRVVPVKGSDPDQAFIQMVTDLMLDPAADSVDASGYDGVEVDVLSRDMDSFNIHARTPGTFQQASYRYTHPLDAERDDEWQTVRVPWTSFMGCADGKRQDECEMMDPLDPSELRRIGFVAIGKEEDVYLAVAGVRFYSVI